MKSKVPSSLRAGLAALLIATTGGYATYTYVDGQAQEMTRNQYVTAAAADKGTSQAVKLAMVMASYYESSFRHIGTPYVDKLGNGRTLTKRPWSSFSLLRRGVFGGHVAANS